MKHCPACKTDKDESAFYAEPGRPGGRSSTCKDCKRASNARYWRETYYPAHRQEQKDAVVKRRRDLKKQAPV